MKSETHASSVKSARWLGAGAIGLTLLLGTSQNVLSAPSGRYVFSILDRFKGPPDAAYPWAGLVLAPDGNLYGTSWAGGSHPECKGGLGSGCGAIFRLDSTGKEKVIFSFVGVRGPIHMYGSLLPTGDSTFYGLTNEGGTTPFCYNGNANGCGTVFRLENGKLTVIYNFGSQGGQSDGLYPEGELIADGQGNFYGTTSQGGTNGNGTVFEVSKAGRESVVYRFTGSADGAGPTSSLVMDAQGNLYGTASRGGGACNCGTIFMLSPGGVLSVLYTFQGGTDGGDPVSGLTRDSGGNLYGTAALDGDAGCNNGAGCGTVFALAPSGAFAVLHAFTGTPDGMLPFSRLARDGAGNLYGTTWLGGTGACDNGYGCGTVFEVGANGSERVLHSFRGGRAGLTPKGDLYLDGSGDLFGATQLGGTVDKQCAGGCGVLYELTPSAP